MEWRIFLRAFSMKQYIMQCRRLLWFIWSVFMQYKKTQEKHISSHSSSFIDECSTGFLCIIHGMPDMCATYHDAMEDAIFSGTYAVTACIWWFFWLNRKLYFSFECLWKWKRNAFTIDCFNTPTETVIVKVQHAIWKVELKKKIHRTQNVYK